MEDYPPAASREPGEIEKVIGHSGRAAGFAVAMSSGELRLLKVAGTAEGSRVDWDAYARHGRASWEDLWSGGADRAVVRVFCQPSTEAPEPFDDREKWTAFRLNSADMPQTALGFAEAGSEHGERMMEA